MSILRVTAQRVARPALARSFSVSAARSDIVQDLYINQLKSYKAPPQPKDAHANAVRTFSAPAAPQPPQLPTDLAAEMSKFDAQEPTLGNSTAAATSAPKESAEEGQSAADYLKFLEADLPKKDAHH